MRQRMLQLADNGFLRYSILRRTDCAAGDFQADLPAAQCLGRLRQRLKQLLCLAAGAARDKDLSLIHILAQVERVNAFCRSHQAGLAWKFLDHCYIYQSPEKIDWLQPQKESDIGPEPFIDCPAQDRHQTCLLYTSTGAATDNRNPVFPSFIVNQAGRRFVCEDATYAYHYRAIYQQEMQLQGPTYMIFGASSLEAPGAPWTTESVAKDIADGVVITADTLEELAGKLGIDAAGLARTMKDWNEDVAAGTDPFGRKDGLEPISGPFYAYKNTSYNLGALGGLKITTDCEVVDVNDKVIEACMRPA